MSVQSPILALLRKQNQFYEVKDLQLEEYGAQASAGGIVERPEPVPRGLDVQSQPGSDNL
jgi:hypothetical protein